MNRKERHRLYHTARWKDLRKKVLWEEKQCRRCEKRGVFSVPDTVNHIKPHRGDPVLFFDRENLEAVCAQCHGGLIQREEKSGHKIGCDLEGIPIDEEHPWRKERKKTNLIKPK